MPPTILLLLFPLAMAIPAVLLRRVRPLGHLVGVLVLAGEVYACLQLPVGTELLVMGRPLLLGEAERLMLAWGSGASAILILADAAFTSSGALPPGLLILTSFSGLALAVEPLPFAPLALWLLVPVATFIFQPNTLLAHRGVLRLVILSASGLPAFVLGALLVSQTTLRDPIAVPPWETVAVLFIVGAAAWLGFFPFQAWVPGLARARRPLSAGWVFGVFQPLVLATLVRIFAQNPDLWVQPKAQEIALLFGLASVIAGAIFAASAKRAGHVWGYSAVVGIAWLFTELFATGTAIPRLYWLGVAGYALSNLAAGAGMAAIGPKARSIGLHEWIGLASERPGAVALLVLGGLGLCGIPLSSGFCTYHPDIAAPLALPSGIATVFRLAPLVAAFGWWRVLWASLQKRGSPRRQVSALTGAFAWAFAALTAAAFIWSGLLLRVGQTLLNALGGH